MGQPNGYPLNTMVDAVLDPPSATLLRAAFGRFPTGVTIITCIDAHGQRVGLTANSLVSLSLEPALLGWSLRLHSPSMAAFAGAKHFAVNVLAESQIELSRCFASARGDKFSMGAWYRGMGGAPLLSGAAATFECEPEASHLTGDHRLFVGRIVRASDAGLEPLVFNAGRYHLVGEIL